MLVLRKSVRGSIRLAIGLALCLSLVQISPAQSQTNFKSSGGSASWVLYSADGSAMSNGEVFSNRATGQDPQTFLAMSFATQTPATLVEVSGYALIPNQAFQGDSTDHMSLDVDLSQVTGFTSCTTDYTNNKTVTCTDSPTATISIKCSKPSFHIVEASRMFNRDRFDF